MIDGKPFDREALAQLYALVSAEGGVTTTELGLLVGEFAERPIAAADLQAYREGRKPWKKLRDELVPVSHLLASRYPPGARVRFPLDDQPPDAWVWSAGGPLHGIEVTGALARAGVEAAKDLADRKVGRGFIGLQDGAPQAAFDAARARRRITSSRVGVNGALDRAIDACLTKKDRPVYAGFTLMIVAPLRSSPNRSMDQWRQAHLVRAAAIPFARIYLMDAVRGSVVIDLK